ncbi:MAG TPA: hypothetical protein VFO85_16170, partial [Vicinamibacteria bacterium]|nr:hypothetical protein [Vicinamibacteria bacterium]
ERFEQAGEKLAAAATAAGEVAEAVSEGHEEARQALAQFGTALEAAHDEVQETGRKTVEALASAVTEMGISADAWVDSLGELLTQQTTALLTAANGMILDHNTSMGHVKERLGDGVEKAAAGPVSQLVSALDELQVVADSHQQLLTGEARAILGRIAAALPEIQQLAQSFRDNARLG